MPRLIPPPVCLPLPGRRVTAACRVWDMKLPSDGLTFYQPTYRDALMKTFSLIVAVVAVASAVYAAQQSSTSDSPGAPAAAAQAKSGAKLFHVVSLKFKSSATKAQIKAVEDAFAGLKEKIPGITSIEWGTNVSPEKHDKGFTHCFILAFNSEKDRDAYLPHPEHKAFGKVLGPVMEDVFVIDFWSKGGREHH